MATLQTAQGIREVIDRCLKYPKASLISQAKWGELNFEEIRPEIEATVLLNEKLKYLPIEVLPESQANGLRQALRQTADILGRINGLSVSQSNAAAERLNLMNELRQQYENLFRLGSSLVPYLSIHAGEVETNLAAMKAAIDEAKRAASAASEDARKQAAAVVDELRKRTVQIEHEARGRVDEIAEIAKKAREASGAIGTAVFANDFRGAADQYDLQAVTWLKAAVVISACTLAAAGAMWLFAQESSSPGKITQIVTARLFILGLFITATLWCGRIHRALKHLATVNRHRALSIQTFQAFSKAASDAATKDAVLLEATRAVFGNVPTGYIEDASDGDIKVLEIARNILPRPDRQQ